MSTLLVVVFSISRIRILYYVDIVGSVVAYIVIMHVQYCLLIPCSHKCGKIYTRFHAFMSYTYNLLLFLLGYDQ